MDRRRPADRHAFRRPLWRRGNAVLARRPTRTSTSLEGSPAMMICDAQVHIWGANTPERPWPARAEPHRAPLVKEELLAEMGKAGVDRVILVPPSWEGDRNDVAIDACKSHPDRFAIMGRLDPDAPH